MEVIYPAKAVALLLGESGVYDHDVALSFDINSYFHRVHSLDAGAFAA